jgi:ribonuclease BN (tRNA processing enzyme)
MGDIHSIQYNIISTGSCGNAVIINDYILIDCGVPFKALKQYYKKFSIVLLTHIHSDHFNSNTISKLTFERPLLRFGCCEWLVKPLMECGVSKNNIDVYESDIEYDYGICKIIPVKLTHNVPNCGYKVHFNNDKLFYATDTNLLEGIEAKGYDLYMVEANYEEDEIQERIQEKYYNGEYPYEINVLQNHLSKKKCDNFLHRNMDWNSEFIYMHQHINKK